MKLTIVIAVILMLAGGLIAIGNWWSVYRSYRTKRFHSSVPFIGAGLLGLGMFILPATRMYCWTAVILDYSTLAFLVAFPRLAQEFWRTTRFNLVSEYIGRTSTITVCLRLFRSGVFIMRIELHLPPNRCGLRSTGTTGRWRREGTRLILQTQSESGIFDVVTSAPTERLRHSVGLQSLEKNSGVSLSGIDLVLVEK